MPMTHNSISSATSEQHLFSSSPFNRSSSFLSIPLPLLRQTPHGCKSSGYRTPCYDWVPQLLRVCAQRILPEFDRDCARMGDDTGPKDEGHVQLARSDSELKARSVLSDVDPWTAWFYKPHTLIFSFFGALLLVWASGALQPEEQDLDPASHTKRGVWAVIAVFMGYSLLQAPPTILVRPHPVFWRFIHGMAVVYLVFLTFILFQSRDGARQFLKNLHPDLGVELKERSYGTDCRIYTPEKPNKFSNVYDTLFDEYVVAHTIGWWCKAITIRNQPFLWTLSIAFEFAERTFIHMLPNFNECWWDSFVLDVLICNWFGIWAGMKTVKYFDGKTYNWVGVSQQKTIIDKARRFLGQFTPAFWDKDEWNALQGPWRFLEVLACGAVFLSVEVMGFFLKFILWIPPLNPLNSYRLAVWWLIANPAIREYNMFLQSSGPAKLGAFCWLGISLAIMEALVCVKFGRGIVPSNTRLLFESLNKHSTPTFVLK